MRGARGRYSFSSVYGNGVSNPVTRTMGASRCRKQRSVDERDELGAEAAGAGRLVHDDDAPGLLHARDDGRRCRAASSVRRSMTSQSMPSSAASRAA